MKIQIATLSLLATLTAASSAFAQAEYTIGSNGQARRTNGFAQQSRYSVPQQTNGYYVPPVQQTTNRPAVRWTPPGGSTTPTPPAWQPKLGFLGTMVYGRGLRVDAVDPNSKAKQIGLEAGDFLTHVWGTRIQTFDHYLQLLQYCHTYRNGQVRLQLENNNPFTATPIVTVNFNLYASSTGGQGYGVPAQGYGSPAQGYGTPAQGYGTGTQAYGSPQVGRQAPADLQVGKPAFASPQGGGAQTFGNPRP